MRGYGCAAFAFELSDAAFGDLPGRELHEFDNIRVGDIIRVENGNHSVVVLEVYSDKIVVCEGNFNSSVHWGREISRTDTSSWTYILTRYPD